MRDRAKDHYYYRQPSRVHRGGIKYAFVNAEAEAISDAFSTPVSGVHKAQIDTFVGALKTAGIWSAADRMWWCGGHSQADSLLDWKAPTDSGRALIAVNSPTFVADRGWTSNGTTSRLRTQFTPSINGVNFVQDSASMWVLNLTDVNETSVDIGVAGGTYIISRLNGVQMAITVNDVTLSAVNHSTTSIGLFGAQRVSSATKKAWRNGVQVGADLAVASTATSAFEHWLCGGNGTSFSTKQIAFGMFADSLAGKEAALWSAVQTYAQARGMSV